MSIGNTSRNTSVGKQSSDVVSQSFINDPTSVTGASILLNEWTFGVADTSGFGFPAPLSGLATLNIYAGTGLGGTLIGSTTTYTTAGTFFNETATWTFGGGLSLIDNLTYTAALISSANLSFAASDANPYADGFLTSTNSSIAGILGQNYDAVFQANFSSDPTAVPFEFEATGGLAILGGGWLLRRHLKKRATKVKQEN